jgi:hypothetical protein
VHPVPAAKTALKAILTARLAWAAVDIRDDPPTENSDVSVYMFWFEPTKIPRDAWVAGGGSRQITFQLGFSIENLLKGDDGRTAEDSVWVLLDDLMTALKASPGLSGSVMSVGDVTGEMANGAAPGLWQARFTGSIECQSNFY